MRNRHTGQQANQQERIGQACARAGTLRDKIETVKRSANDVKELARALKSELRETLNMLTAIRRQMKDLTTVETDKHKAPLSKPVAGGAKCGSSI